MKCERGRKALFLLHEPSHYEAADKGVDPLDEVPVVDAEKEGAQEKGDLFTEDPLHTAKQQPAEAELLHKGSKEAVEQKSACKRYIVVIGGAFEKGGHFIRIVYEGQDKARCQSEQVVEHKGGNYARSAAGGQLKGQPLLFSEGQEMKHVPFAEDEPQYHYGQGPDAYVKGQAYDRGI